jgi:hypothetical protein
MILVRCSMKTSSVDLAGTAGGARCLNAISGHAGECSRRLKQVVELAQTGNRLAVQRFFPDQILKLVRLQADELEGDEQLQGEMVRVEAYLGGDLGL